MNIQIFGMGCKKCNALEQNAREAAKDLAIDAVIEKVSDPAAIAEMGIMLTPAIAVDGIVKSAGKVLTKEQIENFLKEKM